LTEIRWSLEAADDLQHIVNRIRRDNPKAARQVAEIIYSRCASLENFPDRGRIGRIAGTRELVFAPLPYIVVYRVKPSAVEIVRIYHAAQNWP
jgi:toxin ParE1/3/4